MKKRYLWLALCSVALSTFFIYLYFDADSKATIDTATVLDTPPAKSDSITPKLSDNNFVSKEIKLDLEEEAELISSETVIDSESLPAWKQALRQSDHIHDKLFLARSYPSLPLEEHENLLLSAYQTNPSDFYINHQILIYCHEDPSSTLCGLPFVSTLMSTSDNDIFVLRLIASYQYKAGDITSALTTLNKSQDIGNKASIGVRYLDLVDQSYNRLGFARTLATINRFGISAYRANLGLSQDVFSMCSEQTDIGSNDWIQACTGFGKSLTTLSEDPNLQEAGEIVQVAYSGLSEEQKQIAFEEIGQKYETPDFNFLVWLQDYYPQQEDFDSLINQPVSDAIWEQYLSIQTNKGRVAAAKYLYETFTQDR